jgi:BolA family transcriptional regulator, general stress-responsive regulator
MTDHYADLTHAGSSLDRVDLSQSAGNPAAVPIDSFATPSYSSAMSMKNLITDKLSAAFAPQSLDVIDESHLHAGHSGHRPGGETHYRVHIVSEAFQGKSRVDRHRMINQTLSGELASTVHALAINARAPGEG